MDNMSKLKHDLYPVIFFGGMYGSSLGLFISQHDSFYSFMYSPEFDKNGNLINAMEGIYDFDSDIDNINNKLSCHEYKNKFSCKFTIGWSHFDFPPELYDEIGKSVFPTFIGVNKISFKILIDRFYRKFTGFDEDNLFIKKRQMEMVEKICEKMNDDDLYFSPSVNKIIENTQYKEGKDYFILDIFFYKKFIDDENLYKKFCFFLDTEPRPTYVSDIWQIKQIIKLDGIL